MRRTAESVSSTMFFCFMGARRELDRMHHMASVTNAHNTRRKLIARRRAGTNVTLSRRDDPCFFAVKDLRLNALRIPVPVVSMNQWQAWTNRFLDAATFLNDARGDKRGYQTGGIHPNTALPFQSDHACCARET
jgi:hypothetical protein